MKHNTKKLISRLLSALFVATLLFSFNTGEANAKATLGSGKATKNSKYTKPSVSFGVFPPEFETDIMSSVAIYSRNVGYADYYITAKNTDTEQSTLLTTGWQTIYGNSPCYVSIPRKEGNYELIVRAKIKGAPYNAQNTTIRVIKFKVYESRKMTSILSSVLSKDNEAYGVVKDSEALKYNSTMRITGKNILLKNVTVDGDLYLQNDNIKLQNVKVKGTLYIDPGTNGKATIENTEAKVIRVLSGSSSGIQLNDVKSDLLIMVSRMFTGVVANKGTAINEITVLSDSVLDLKESKIDKISVIESLTEKIVSAKDGIDIQVGGTISAPIEFGRNGSIRTLSGAVIDKVVANTPYEMPLRIDGTFKNVVVNQMCWLTLTGYTTIGESLSVISDAKIYALSGSSVAKLDINPAKKSSITLDGTFKYVEYNKASVVKLNYNSIIKSLRANAVADILINDKASVVQVLNYKGLAVYNDIITGKVTIGKDGRVIKDKTEPKFASGTPKVESVGLTSAILTLKLEEPGSIYYRVMISGGTDLDKTQMLYGKTVNVANEMDEYIVPLVGLQSKTKYAVYTLAVDTNGNIQSKVTKTSFTTTADTTPPDFYSGYPKAGVVTETTADVTVKMEEDSKIYWKIVEGGQSTPSIAQIVSENRILAVERNKVENIVIAGLIENKDYDIYLVAKDYNDTLQNSVSKVAIKTIKYVDLEPPKFLAGYPELEHVLKLADKFEAEVLLKLDEVSNVYIKVVDSSTSGITVDDIIQTGISTTTVINTEMAMVIPNLDANTTYTILVVAVDSSGNKQVSSSSITVTTPGL